MGITGVDVAVIDGIITSCIKLSDLEENQKLSSVNFKTIPSFRLKRKPTHERLRAISIVSQWAEHLNFLG
jgi:hypothetical protein